MDMHQLAVISIVQQVATDPGYHLQVTDIEQWESRHGPIPRGSVVMVRSDWSKDWPDPQLATRTVFPGVSLAALQFLHLQRHILFHGHEPLDTDTTPTLEGESWLMHNGYTQAEGVANLDQVSETGCLIAIGYPKFQGGLGGYAVLVDGPYGYLYRGGGAGTVTMQGTVTNGSTTLTPTGNLNYAFIAGAVLSDTAGAIPPGTTVVSLNFNTVTILMSAAATASPGAETITATLPAFQQIVDPAFLGADRVAFIEGWLIFNQPGTRTFYTTAPVPYTVDFAGAFYALKDSSTDNLVTLFENNRELWLVGEKTTEVWYNSGGANFAFSRIPGVGPQIGCSAKHSITRMGTALTWLARNEQGENMVVVTDQYTWRRISHHGVDHALASYPVVSDALGYAYQEEGHLFYMLTLPTADVTWCFDGTAEKWHQRLSFDQNTGVFHRHRSNVYADFADVRLVGDYTTGQIHQMSRAFYTDAGNPLVCVRRCPHIWSRENRKRIFYSALQIEFTPGVGLSVGQGSNPQAMLQWQDEYGAWSNQHWTTIGATGATRNRAIWRRLAEARDRIYECTFSDPTARDIVGATLFAEPEANEEAA